MKDLPLAAGPATAHLWIGNGYSQKEVFSTYADKKAEMLTVNDQLPEFLAPIKDATVGSRIAVRLIFWFQSSRSAR